MDVLEMTDLEVYKLGIKELTEKIGPVYTEQFLKQCKPREYDYTAERHKLQANAPDIPTIVKQIQQASAAQEKEERIKNERVTAWRDGILELTDIEIYELALKILADRLDAYGLATFIMYHFKQSGSNKYVNLFQQSLPEDNADVTHTEQEREVEPQD